MHDNHHHVKQNVLRSVVCCLTIGCNSKLCLIIMVIMIIIMRVDNRDKGFQDDNF